jgi:hypothetical protein
MQHCRMHDARIICGVLFLLAASITMLFGKQQSFETHAPADQITGATPLAEMTPMLRKLSSTCAAGKYFLETLCYACPSGQYSLSGASLSCSTCVAGFYNPVTTASACTSCNAGTFAATTGNNNVKKCLSCTGGKYSAAGATVCTSCVAGTAVGGTGGTACINCIGGKYEAICISHSCSSKHDSARSHSPTSLVFPKVFGYGSERVLQLCCGILPIEHGGDNMLLLFGRHFCDPGLRAVLQLCGS